MFNASSNNSTSGSDSEYDMYMDGYDGLIGREQLILLAEKEREVTATQKKQVCNGKTSVHIFKSMCAEHSPEDAAALKMYVARGAEINAKLRAAMHDGMKNINRITKALRCRPFGQKPRYVFVYRNQTVEWDNDISKGFLSTVNKSFGIKFGSYAMKIMIDTLTKHIGVTNISKQAGGRDVYEVVLPINTRLKYVGEAGGYNLFVAK